jgi:pimeloyl-ACP methyl ester carboxylesterase
MLFGRYLGARNSRRSGGRRMSYIEANGTKIYYERRGHGPAVLFISGATGDAGHWTSVGGLSRTRTRSSATTAEATPAVHPRRPGR